MYLFINNHRLNMYTLDISGFLSIFYYFLIIPCLIAVILTDSLTF